MLKAWKEKVSDLAWANGHEFEYQPIITEHRVQGTLGPIWASPETFGILWAMAMGQDTVTGIDTTGKQHSITMVDITDPSIGGFTIGQNFDAGTGSSYIYTGCQIEAVTINIGQRGFATLSAEIVGATRTTASLTSYTTAPTAYIPNNKIAVFAAPKSSNSVSNYDGSITTPTTGAPPSSGDLGTSEINLANRLQSLTITYRNNLDIDASFGPGMGLGSGEQRGEAYWTRREITGSMTLALDPNTDDLIFDLFDQTNSDYHQWCIELIGTSDTLAGSTSLAAGFALVLPLVAIEPEPDMTSDMGPTYITVNFKAVDSDEDPCYAFVWDRHSNAYNTAA
jgi:hypothetical protein